MNNYKEQFIGGIPKRREQHRQDMQGKQQHLAALVSLRSALERAAGTGKYDPGKNFGYFLEQYILLQHKKQRMFAKEIGIRETLLSQYINGKKEPDKSMIVRLEIHSENKFPAVLWYKLIRTAREYQIKHDMSLRKHEEQFVNGRLRISF